MPCRPAMFRACPDVSQSGPVDHLFVRHAEKPPSECRSHFPGLTFDLRYFLVVHFSFYEKYVTK